MTFLLSFADSEVAGVQAEPDGLLLRFAAAHVTLQADDAPADSGNRTGAGVDSSPSGYVRHLALRLHAPPGPALPPDLFGRIASGHLSLDGQRLRRLVVPGELRGELLLVLEFANRASLTQRASVASLQFSGDPLFTESLAC